MTTPDLRPDQQPDTTSRAPMYAALGVVVLVLVIAFGSWLVRDDEMWTGSDAASGSASQGAAGDVELALPARESGRCMPVQADTLAKAEDAFDGEVVDVSGSTVTIAVSEWYAGDNQATRVRLDAGRASSSLEGHFDFQEGRRYLVAANDDTVLVCGLSGPYSADLERVYQEAFPG